MLYLVTWSIEVEADTPEAAAKQAREIQLDPESIAVHFLVEAAESESEAKSVDLLDSW
jgi:hypothetical protein